MGTTKYWLIIIFEFKTQNLPFPLMTPTWAFLTIIQST